MKNSKLKYVIQRKNPKGVAYQKANLPILLESTAKINNHV